MSTTNNAPVGTQPAEKHASTLGDHKFYGWTVVWAAFTVIFLHLSIRGSFAVFLKPMVQDLGWTTADVSVGLSLFMLFYGVTAFFAGAMMDRFGPRKVLFIHGLFLGGGLVFSAYITAPWQFYLSYGVIGGIGAGGLFVPPTSMVRKWFMAQMGKALGMAVGGAGLGFFLAPIASMFLIEYWTWRFAMQVFGVIIVVGVGIASYFANDNPESMGQKPLGFEEFIKRQAAAGASAAKEIRWSMAEAVKTSAFWTISAMWFFSNFAEYIVFSHSVNYVVTDHGFNPKTAAMLFSIMGLCFLVFGPVGGNWADKLSLKWGNDFKARKFMIAGCYTVVALACVWLTQVREPAHYLVYCLIYGIPFGIYIPSVAAYVGTTFGRASMGAVWGLVTMLGVAGGAGLGPWVGGKLRDITGNYQASIWLAVGIYACAVILCLLVKKPEKAA